MQKVETEVKEPKTIKAYKLKIVFTEPMLASSPADPEVYKRFIIERKRKQIETLKELQEKAFGNESAEAIPELSADELETLSVEGREQSGWSVFHKTEVGLHIFDYKVRGFFKEAANCMTAKGDLSASRSKIDKWLFVFPRIIHLKNPDGSHILEPHGILERPLRAMTMQGPRVSLKRSDYVNAGTYFECEVRVLPNGQRELNENRLREWVSYGQYSGFGEWRTGSYGRFEATLQPQE